MEVERGEEGGRLYLFCVDDEVICVYFVVDADVVVRWNGCYLASYFIYCVVNGLWFPRSMEVMKDCAASPSVIVVVETDDDMSIKRERARLILVKNTRVPAGHEAADVRRARHDECLGGRRERERGMETKPGGQEVL